MGSLASDTDGTHSYFFSPPSNMELKVIILLFGLFGLSAGKNHTCQACKKLTKLAAEFYSTDQTIEDLLDVFLNSTCAEVSEKYGLKSCSTDLPKIWPPIGKGIFGSEKGWFNYKDWCECLNCLEESREFYDDAVILSDIIYIFNYQGFCPEFRGNDVEECRKRFTYILPRVMRALKTNKNSREMHTRLCEDFVKCVN